MPKLQKSKERELAELMARNLILRANQLCLYSDVDISARIGMTRPTFSNRKKDAGSWKLIEFTRAAVALGTTLDWLCKDHSSECKEGLK